jgi:DNA mismatch repair protein MutL
LTRRIQILPDRVANQIAAGEVVERPASVVKELVENALDAGATAVEVQVERAGKRRIRVSDDGHGMVRADALLCLDRHATSKISEAEDLRSVRSFGFRGEALPSIAAVSRLSLETRGNEEGVGTAVRATGGRILAVEDCARQAGTTVDVQGLFFNAPARAKFLKSTSIESRAITDAVVTLALAHPQVAFRLLSDGRPVLELPASGDLVARLTDLWGPEAAGTLLAVRGEREGLELRGLIQRPDAAEPGFRRAYLFVNGRPFRESTLLRAVDRGFRTTVSARVRPWLFLYLTVPDGSVDVNVHPAKAEVRFRDTAGVETLVEEAVRAALAGEGSGATFDTQLRPPALAVRDRPAEGRTPERRSTDQMALFLSGAEMLGEEASSGDDGRATAPLQAERPRLWQAHLTYLLAETRDGLLIIDQHSAHERVLFERLMRAFGSGGEIGQRLLFPLTLRLTPAECRRVEELSGILKAAGFEVEGFGGDTVIVQTVPNPHPYFDAARCFREMVAELTEGSELVRSAGNQHERIAMTFACKGAIKAGQRLSEPEMQQLFDALFATELPYHDVHGRPTIVRLPSRELERKFGR